MKRKDFRVSARWQVSLALTVGLLALVWLVSTTLAQEPAGTGTTSNPTDRSPLGGSPTETFAYQGYLEDGGQPANGVYDFRFSVWDQDANGTMIGNPMEFDSWITVQDGIFSAYLFPDPANTVFTGGARWLQIEVRPGDSIGPYTNLGRQPIVPVPYAWSLRPEAMVSGDTGTDSGFGDAILNLDNTRELWGGGNTSTLYARASTGSAVRGESGGVGVYGYSSSTYAVRGESLLGTAGYFTTDEGYGVYAETQGLDHWDHGGYFSAEMGYGVYGVSAQNYGVRGEGYFGVRGDGQASGVSGWSQGGTGVQGSSSTGTGVRGSSTYGTGVYGYSPYSIGVNGYSQDDIGVYGYSQTDIPVVGVQQNYSTADWSLWDPGGLFGGRNGVVGVSKEPDGYGVVGANLATSGYNSRGVYGRTNSPDGWAGFFHTGSGNGLYVSAPTGKIGLSVASGTKNAVVGTDQGSRLLYSEESTEVWFTDYGFGQLEGGQDTITIDPVFAQTVNLSEPYHVFVQVYGNAEVYVTNRTATRFEVHLRDGDPEAEFSYRIVARRLGYEEDRLEPAPWADNDPNLYPEKQGEQAQPGGSP